VPKTFIYELARRGEIPCVTLGRYRRFRADAIQEWIEEQECSSSTATRRGRMSDQLDHLPLVRYSESPS
jgi:excisionase family DNA binding protein